MKAPSCIVIVYTLVSMCSRCVDALVPSFSRRALVNSVTTATLLSPVLCASASDDDEPTAGSQSSNVLVEQSDALTIHFEGPVTIDSCSALRSALREGRQQSLAIQTSLKLEKAPPVHLHIQSQGGALLPTFAVVDEIRQTNQPPVYSYISGYAASAATLIAVACERRFAQPNSLMLLHQLSAGAEGRLSSMTDSMKNLQLLDTMMKRLYLERTRIKAGELDDLLKHDLWLDAESCFRMGIIDEILR